MLWLFVSHFGVLECYLYECGFFRHSGQMEWPSPLSCAIWGFCDIVRKWMGGGGGGGGGGGPDQENLFLGIDKKRNP